VRALQAVRVDRVMRDGRPASVPVPGSTFELKADLVLLAMGFTGPVRHRLFDELGVRMTDRGTVWRDAGWRTSVPGVYAAGDVQRGQSLVVWAIADGRQAAAAIDADLRAY
jgi:glutamate synthase (NADPH/NADH) small chain